MFHEYCENESVDPTPCPVPDINKLPKYHYLPVAETPITIQTTVKEEKWKIIGHVTFKASPPEE